jgi:hypothetical protein
MKKIFKNAAALVAAAATAVLSSCSGDELAYFKSPSLSINLVTLNFDIQNGCPTATAEGTVKDQDSTLVAYGDLSVTLAEEQIAIPGDQDFGTAYSNGDWETGFEYTDGQYATVTWDSSDRDRFKVEEVVFNEDKTVVTPAADGMSAQVTLSYTATVKYIGDSIYTAEVELNPYYTQYKVENTPSVVEPEETFHVVSFEVKDFSGNNKCNVYGIWTIESNGVTYSEKACFAEFASDGVYQSGVIVSRKAVLKETRHEFETIAGDITTKGNLTLAADTLVLYETINMGNVTPIKDTRSMVLRDVTFTDPITGEAHHLDVTGYITSDYKEVVEEGRETITTGDNVKYSYDGKSVLFTTYYHISYTYNGETVEYTPTSCTARDYHYSGYHYED